MKTWQQKLKSGKAHEIKTAPMNFADIKKGQQMLIPSAKVLDAYICKLPAARVVDSKSLRTGLACEYGAEVSCPLVTGIQLRVVAEAAFEAYQAGTPLDKITPFWRAINRQASTLKKISFDNTFIFEQQQREQQEVKHKG